MTIDMAGTRIGREARGRKNKLPDPFAAGAGIFFSKRLREKGFPAAGGKIGLMQAADGLQVGLEQFDK